MRSWFLALVGGAGLVLLSGGAQAQTLEGSIWEGEDHTGVSRLELRGDSTFRVRTPDLSTPFTGQYEVEGKYVRMFVELPTDAAEPVIREIVLLYRDGTLVIPEPRLDEKVIEFRRME
ncbi:MAG: hypothetical protein HKN04_04265 [Rhodothermaceae bacterium]|nr:hypothetical protein [Rhodothermaceae bacterium]